MPATDDEVMKRKRASMVREIERIAADILPDVERREISRRVLDVMGEIPRHAFVPLTYRDEAYRNAPIPLGAGQTISQPFIVALMTDLLDLTPESRVLEVGTGSGYQTAILAKLAAHVFTIELSKPLAERALQNIKKLDLHNVSSRTGDGHLGWPDEPPFDAILVTAAPAHIPAPLLGQLKRPGGRMVIPVGGRAQKLVLVEQQIDGVPILRDILPVCFVPLTTESPG